ncbi:pilus assembly FimT family protein [Clostridium sp. HCP1S3_B4]|uniref:pilus assembly FimT family protein n=1 Tax=unclassified Clostridium TaxID=2614128 RepID=UPI003F8CD099
MKRKHKGYSLVECSAVFAIVIITASITGKCIKNYNDIISYINLKSAAYEIDDILNYAKKYCYNNNTSGIIEIINDKDKSCIAFVINAENKKIVYLPEGITFYNMQEYTVMYLTPKGILRGIKIQLQSSINKFIATISANVSTNRIKIKR